MLESLRGLALLVAARLTFLRVVAFLRVSSWCRAPACVDIEDVRGCPDRGLSGRSLRKTLRNVASQQLCGGIGVTSGHPLTYSNAGYKIDVL